MVWPFRKPKTSIAVDVSGPPLSIPVVPKEDTTDPMTYALMAAMQGGTGYVYQDDEGVWRDADDQPIPNLNG